jgi:hypothetical protein
MQGGWLEGLRLQEPGAVRQAFNKNKMKPVGGPLCTIGSAAMSSASAALLGAERKTPSEKTSAITDPIETETQAPTVVTVLEHHDEEGAILDVALVRPRSWLFLTVEETRDLADQLLDAADLAEESSKESEVPLRSHY